MSFKTKSFKSVLNAIVDNRGRTCPVESYGLPLIATNCVTNDTLYPALKTDRFVSDSTYRSWFRGHPLQDDILFTCKGTPGRVNLVPPGVGFCIAQDMVAIRADVTQITPHYLFAVLRSPKVQADIANLHVGSTIPHFKKGDFDKLEIPIPTFEKQQMIGNFYFNLSKMIDEITRQNTTLEVLAQSLFKSWFVNFDPVYAKAAGRTPEGMGPEFAALFPSEFVESELGMIPKGWISGSFKNVVVKESAKVGKDRTDVKVMSAIQSGELVLSDDLFNKRVYSKSIENYRLVAVGSFAYNPSRINIGSIGRNDFEFEGAVSPVYVVFRPTGEQLSTFIEYQLKRPQIKANIIAACSGTVRQSLNFEDFCNITFVVPSNEVITNFDNKLKALKKLIKVNTAQSLLLANIRDELLPRLISGKLRIEEADEAVLEVLGSTAKEEKAA